jgi:alkylation response protein AidB-like acyl-CoA dehydrogenase
LTSVPDIETLRRNVRAWIAQNSPHHWRSTLAEATEEQRAEFDRALLHQLNDAGLAVPHWPVEYGGAGLPLSHQLAIHEEFIRADAAWPATFYCSLNHAAHVLIHFGTEAQQAHLSRILAGDEIWCQAFSEPEAGSDLPALRTTAELLDGHYLLNGQKVWTSRGAVADRAIVLARTSTAGDKPGGISMFGVDLHGPGIQVRPIRQATGESEFAEIFFMNAAVAITDLIGAENKGWVIARAMLAAERGPGMLRFALSLEVALDAMIVLARRRGLLDSPPPHLADIPLALGELVTDVEVLRQLVGKVLDELAVAGENTRQSPSLKIGFSEAHLRLTELAVRIEGLPGQYAVDPATAFPISDSGWLTERLRSYRYLIGAGTNEIQRNHIAEQILHLPREPRVR